MRPRHRAPPRRSPPTRTSGIFSVSLCAASGSRDFVCFAVLRFIAGELTSFRIALVGRQESWQESMMPIRLVPVLFSMFLAASSLIAQVREAEYPTRPKMGDMIGPLILREVEPTNGWIGVTWDPKAPSSQRRFGDKAASPADDNPFLSIQLDFIDARFSSDPIENDSFRRQYSEGVKTLLSDHRAFWFQVAKMDYQGCGQIGGMFLLDDMDGPTIQKEMARCRYAVTTMAMEMVRFWQRILEQASVSARSTAWYGLLTPIRSCRSIMILLATFERAIFRIQCDHSSL